MTVRKTVCGNRMELEMEGKFDAVSAPKFETEYSAQLEGINELSINMSAVEYISSAGLRALLFLQQTMEETGGSLSVRNPSAVVMDIFEITGFSDVISIE